MQRESIFDKLIPENAAKKLAEQFLERTANDSMIESLLAPRAQYDSARFHIPRDFDVRALDEPLRPDLNLETYQVKIRPMSANELAWTRRNTLGADLQALAAEYLARHGNPGAWSAMLDSIPAGAPPAGLMYPMYGAYDPTDVDEDRKPGDPYGFADFSGKRLDADPGDKQSSSTRDDLERSQYSGNLYAYKTLIMTGTGKPRSYYKNAGVWSGGWQDAKCLVADGLYSSSRDTARNIHARSTDPLPSTCECGFHCWYGTPPAWESPRVDALTSIPIVVQIAGDVLYADRGVRCEHVKVVAVLDCGNDEDDRTPRKEGYPYPTRAKIAEYFGGVPVLLPDSVYTWAVVEGLRPAAERMQELMRMEVDDD